MFSSARIGVPAATWPTSGTAGRMTRFARSTRISIARGFVGSRRSTPELSSFARWACTVEGECRPRAAPISRTVGG